MKSSQQQTSDRRGGKSPRAVPASAPGQRKRAGLFLFVALILVIVVAGAFHYSHWPKSGANNNPTNAVMTASAVTVTPAATTNPATAMAAATNIFTNFPPRELTKD